MTLAQCFKLVSGICVTFQVLSECLVQIQDSRVTGLIADASGGSFDELYTQAADLYPPLPQAL